MSTEIDVTSLSRHQSLFEIEDHASKDSVRVESPTANVDPTTPIPPPPPPPDPAADHDQQALDTRRAVVEANHHKLADWLAETGRDAAVLGTTSGVSWITGGADAAARLGSDESAVLVFVNRLSRAIVCDNVQTARFFEEEVAGLGFQLKEYPWTDRPTRVLGELGRQKRLAGDLPSLGIDWKAEELSALRFELGRTERRRLREVGWVLGREIEATCRSFARGRTELDVAGELSHRLMRSGVTPMEIRVVGDGRSERFREPRSKSIPIVNSATITAVGCRRGLCASASRTVEFGEIDPALHESHVLASMVAATAICFSRPGAGVAEVFRRIMRILEKYGRPDEWNLAPQGFLTGYRPRELRLTPDGTFQFAEGHAVRWCPSVGPARSDDTALVDHRGFEIVTDTGSWPKLELAVRGLSVFLPAILRRDPD